MADGVVCERCGAFGDMPHTWSEQDCVLPHRNHSAAKVGFCCTWCVDRLRGWLTEIVELYATLDQVLEPGSIPDDTAEHGHVKKKPASPAPMRLAAWAMLRDAARLFDHGNRGSDLPDVPGVVAVHAQNLWDALGYGDAPTTLTGAAATLTANLDTVAGSPWIDEFDADLRWLRKALRDAHGFTAVRPVGHCPSLDGNGQPCDGPLWANTGGKMSVRCGKCEREFDEPFLRHLGGMLSA